MIAPAMLSRIHALAPKDRAADVARIAQVLQGALRQIKAQGFDADVTISGQGCVALRVPLGAAPLAGLKWTPEMDARLLDARRQNKNRDQIAQEMGLSKSAVAKRFIALRKAGVEVPEFDNRASMRQAALLRRVWTPERDKDLLALCCALAPTAEIAARLGCSTGAIERRITTLRGQGVDIPDRRATSAHLALGRSVRKRWTPQRDAAILSASAAGHAHAAIAELVDFPVTADAVAIRLSKLRRGLADQPRQRSQAELRQKDDSDAARAQRRAAVLASMAAHPPAAEAAPTVVAAPEQKSDLAVPLDLPEGAMLWIEQGMTQAAKEAVVAQHLAALAAGEADLHLCEAVFRGASGALSEADLARFRALTQPFRRALFPGLPIETAPLLLAGLRARVARQAVTA